MGRLYPRIRGADVASHNVKHFIHASTPAYAGLTAKPHKAQVTMRLYPRIRGADSWTAGL